MPPTHRAAQGPGRAQDHRAVAARPPRRPEGDPDRAEARAEAGAAASWRPRTPPQRCTSLQAQWQADTNRQTEALDAAAGGARACRSRPAASSASTSPPCRAPTPSAAWSFLPRARRPRATTGASTSRAAAARASRTITPRCARCCAAASAARSKKRWPTPAARRGQVDAAWKLLPDLLIVDGGKGQLGVAVEVLAEFGLTEVVPVVGLAKQHEELFLPGRREPILLPPASQGLFLVQRIRDEAHRFAITAHREKREQDLGDVRAGCDAGHRARARRRHCSSISARSRRSARRPWSNWRGARHDARRGAGDPGEAVK